MKKKFLLGLVLLFGTSSSANQINPNLIEVFALQATPNPTQLPTTLTLFKEVNYAEVMWSILIPTIDERSTLFCTLMQKLLHQINTAGLGNKIEIIFYRDNCQQTVGYKRNSLLKNARGKYTCFVDDDDDVCNDYINLIYAKLATDPDCVRFVSLVTFAGKKQRMLRVHSIAHVQYRNSKTTQYRPVAHLNPIRRTIALQFQFPEYSFGEDQFWSTEITKSGLLKTEAYIDVPYYFYRFDMQKSKTWHQRAKTPRWIRKYRPWQKEERTDKA